MNLYSLEEEEKKNPKKQQNSPKKKLCPKNTKEKSQQLKIPTKVVGQAKRRRLMSLRCRQHDGFPRGLRRIK